MKKILSIRLAAAACALGSVLSAQAATDLKIAHVYGKTGALEVYAKQIQTGLEMGFSYATGGTMEVLGHKIVLIEKDDQLKADRARALVAEAYKDDDAAIVIGPLASGVAIAALPVAKQYKRIIMPEAVADSITGSDYNRYVIHIGRNSSQDAVSNAVAIGGPGVCVSTLAQDYAFGRDAITAYRPALAKTGGRIVSEEYLPTDATDFTAAAQRLFDALKDKPDCKKKYIFIVWAGKANPLAGLNDLRPDRFGIQLTSGGNILPALEGYKPFVGMEGAMYYYYESPKNKVNDWLVAEHMKRFGTPPDFFTAQGMAEAIAIVEAVKLAGSIDTEKLIKAFEGLRFQTPKGEMYIRPQDHQALQEMYHFRIKVDPKVKWAIPELVRVLGIKDMDIPVQNKGAP